MTLLPAAHRSLATTSQVAPLNHREANAHDLHERRSTTQPDHTSIRPALQKRELKVPVSQEQPGASAVRGPFAFNDNRNFWGWWMLRSGGYTIIYICQNSSNGTVTKCELYFM